MINANMKQHDYYLYGENDSYGQPTLSEEVVGSVKMAIHSSNKSVTGDVNYTGGNYIGLTNDPDINDKYVIKYGDERLKVKYIVAVPRHMTQVFMSRM